MKIIRAKSAGFCFGVKRAVETVNEQLQLHEGETIYTYGPIIHNETVVEEFEKKGVLPLSEDFSLKDITPSTIIIRSHGVAPSVINRLEENGFSVVDATCPFVKKIHHIVRDYSKKGYRILIVGNATHPEVQGIIGWITSDRFQVISSAEDISSFDFPKDEKICMVAQTTFNYNKFQELVEIVKEKGYDIVAVNTICNATNERQKEAAQVACSVDVMLVIGGKNSSNTQKLFEICKRECYDTYYIQTEKDLDLTVLQSINSVGITAGASTPNNIIEEVQKRCQK